MLDIDQGIKPTAPPEFVRMPSVDYFRKAFRHTYMYPDFDDVVANYYLIPHQTEGSKKLTAYLNAANDGKLFLHKTLSPEVCTDPELFKHLITEYSKISHYDSFSPDLRDQGTYPIEIPLLIAEELNESLRSLGVERVHIPEAKIKRGIRRLFFMQDTEEAHLSLVERLSSVADLTRTALESGNLDDVWDVTYSYIRSWFTKTGNQGRSMNYTNVLLEKAGQKGISHGIIDFAALTMNREQFHAYMKYVIEILEERSI